MKNNNKGFSLVELIVVIAIMAILAAVAVVGFSVYIPKAQQASDKQMIADIEDILLYEGYAGTFEEGEGGYIILSPEGDAVVKGAALIEALTNAYGADYAKELKLAYDEWSNNGLLNGMDASIANGLANSSYLSGNRADKLLSDVEKMTNMATNLTSMIGGVSEGTSISGMFTKGETCLIDDVAKKHGYVKGENETWEQWAEKDGGKNKTAYSNLLVLTAAEESAKAASDDTYQMSDASALILEFSTYYAYAATDSTFSAKLDERMKELSSVTDFQTGKDWFDGLKADAGDGYTAYMNTGTAGSDKTAFAVLMSSVSNSSNAQAGSLDLNDATLFTEGAVNDMYNDYLANVNAIKGFYDEDLDADEQLNVSLNAGEIAIVFIQKDGQTIITSSVIGE